MPVKFAKDAPRTRQGRTSVLKRGADGNESAFLSLTKWIDVTALNGLVLRKCVPVRMSHAINETLTDLLQMVNVGILGTKVERHHFRILNDGQNRVCP